MNIYTDNAQQHFIVTWRGVAACMYFSSFIYPERGGFGEILPEIMIFGNIIVKGKISSNPPSEGYIKALLYRRNTWIKKTKSLIFKTNNANSRHFGDLWRGCLAWLPRMIILPNCKFPGQNISWSYSPLRSYSSHTRVIRL